LKFGNRVFNGVGKFNRNIATGRTRVIKTKMPKRLVRKLRWGRTPHFNRS
jgi:hypothetical protein